MYPSLFVVAEITNFTQPPEVKVTKVGNKAVCEAHETAHGGETYPTIIPEGAKRRTPQVGDRCGTFIGGRTTFVVWPSA